MCIGWGRVRALQGWLACRYSVRLSLMLFPRRPDGLICWIGDAHLAR